ncbi:DUF2059 domain-containing protein [Reichenbachiella versicolor]|uniref:DUF2059 domain-containing protein n=1 Tax=Reichenbachiella versicolor TaxID=1821036 RepID=UPI001C8879EA|nr:DUF2059 domain-containing protein [Reichenbachiella versicolor]
MACIATLNSFAQSESDYERSLTKLLEVSGAEKTFSMVIQQMMTAMRPQYESVPQEYWDDMEKEFKSTSLTDLVGMLVPIYQKHLTQDDLKEIISFYESPLGKKFAEKQPFITQESMQVGQQWGMQIGMKIAAKMQEQQEGK